MRIAALAVVAALALAGCSSSGSSGSRDELYGSVAGISADSTLVVVGRVTVQEDDDQPQATRVSTLEIAERFTPAGLGSDLDTRLPDKIAGTLQVRQIVEPYMEQGQSYLLFLGPTELPGDDGGQYFITGGDAGVYHVEGTDFVHGEFDGDSLPTTVTRADLG